MAGSYDYSEWMSQLPRDLTCVPLNSLAIPGSHNSFSYSLERSEGVAIDQQGTIQNIGSCCCGAVLSLIHRWSQTQNCSFLQQLNMGIRYFDLRVCVKPETREFYFIHGLYGAHVLSELREINMFLNENPREFIFLDFNHFYNMNSTNHIDLLEGITSIFGEKLVHFENPISTTFFSLTLDNIWTTHMRVMVFYHDDNAIISYSHFWSKYAIYSLWPNTNNINSLASFLEMNYTERRRPDTDQFSVWQGVLTPASGTVLNNFRSSLKETMSRPATTSFLEWVKNKTPGPRGINICTADFVELYNFVPIIINLNYTLLNPQGSS